MTRRILQQDMIKSKKLLNDDIVNHDENKIGNNYIMPKPVRTKILIETILDILGKV